MTDVRFVKPTEKLINSIALDMRQADIDEVWASSHHTPIQALMSSWQSSDFSVVILCDGSPVVIIGLVKRDLLTGSGTVWMLGTNDALNYKKEFVRQTKPIIDDMLSICPMLSNRVHSNNKKSIQWLRFLGFNIGEPVVFGPDNDLFHRFYLERVT